MARADLGRLRAELAREDRAIRRAIERRLRIARRIGVAKRSQGLPVRNRRVEGEVLRRWRVGLVRLGIPRGRADQLGRWLVDEAVRVQESGPTVRHARPRRILVVGGAGAIGRLLADRFRESGHAVRVLDPAARGARSGRHPVVRDLVRSAVGADVVVVATPMQKADAVYRSLWNSSTRAVVFDVYSVKAPVAPWIERGRRAGFRVTSVHPLFGPGTRPLAGEKVLVLECGDRRATAVAASLFRPMGLRVTVLPLAAHDALMADVQALPRLASLAFSLALERAGRTVRGLDRAATPSLRRQVEVSRRVAAEDPDLSFGIQALNPQTIPALRHLTESLAQLGTMIRSRDVVSFRRALARSRRALSSE